MFNANLRERCSKMSIDVVRERALALADAILELDEYKEFVEKVGSFLN